MSTAKVILVILAGLAIGIVSGILLAPRKGLETQQKDMNENDCMIQRMSIVMI